MDKCIMPRAHSVILTIDSNPSPLEIIHHMEAKVKQRDSILSLQAYIGGVFVCTVVGDEPFKDLLSDGTFLFGDKHYDIKPVEANIVGFLIKRLPRVISNDAVISSLRCYGRVLFVEREKQRDNPNVITGNRKVVMELTKDLPYNVRISGVFYKIEV